MILNRDKGECCGCTACMCICPKNAIVMQEDEEGFHVPKINQEKCIECGMCIRVCAFKKSQIKPIMNQKAYGVKIKKNNKRAKSQSGGAFTVVAEQILKDNGSVYGVAMKNAREARYIGIEKMNELVALKGSKYVQANMENCYEKVIRELKQGKQVLFGGTPCHVDGLLTLLKQKNINTDKLYTYDLICHGVPSPKIYREYIDLVETVYDSKVKYFNFRDKTFGWHGHQTSMQCEGYKHEIVSSNYVKIFYSHFCLRKSCYKCPYASTNRVSDITIGDFWGIEKHYDEFDDNKGCSLMIINSLKGEMLFDTIKSEIDYFSTTIEECLQPNLQHPTECPENGQGFWSMYNNEGLEKTIQKYCDYNVTKDYFYRYRRRLITKLKLDIRNIKKQIKYLLKRF